ncbi:MAG: aminoglycoside phosphotransferase family protein [Anaerolineae bacterium]|nr:aminoglycoside phosphotransferase family protein [Anaerolineae bacterium]MCI0609334.1 aminoglycoside phosphotransferase family protein [Anaerolineae bacterium]
MNLPPEFISTITNTFGEDGESLIENLPALINEASTRWGLTNVQPVDNLSYNFVAFADSPLPMGEGLGVREKVNVVLKIGVPRDELTSEIAALRLFNGEGACRLIDADEQKGFLLLERLNPGVMLSTMEDDERATHIGAEVMQKIWRPLDHVTLSDSEGSLTQTNRLFAAERLRVTYNKFIQLSDWFDGLKELRQMFDGGTGPLNEKLVARVEKSVNDFFAENHGSVLMHGDFHHFNILSSERGWLVIDPKGVIGPAGYEVGPFLMNPWGDLLNGTNYRRLTKRRIDILHEQLGFERERIREWGLAHAVLSAWWHIEDNTGGEEYAMNFAEMMADLPLHS